MLSKLASPVAGLALNNSGLVRVKFQPDLDHPLADRVPQHFSLLLARAVHHRIIQIPFEPGGRRS
jgi:hypothetical protein